MRVPLVSVYKPRNRSAAHHPFLLAYKDPDSGKRCVVRSVPDEALACAQATEISRRLQAIRAGLLKPEQQRAQRYAEMPLSAHIADWAQALTARGGTGKHIALTVQRATRVVEAIRPAARAAELTPAAVQVAIDSLTHMHFTRIEVKLSATSRNHHLRAIKMLSRWLWTEGRIERDPLAGVHPWNCETELRHPRRALTQGELEALLRAAESGEARCGMTGHQRAVCYRAAVETGLRASELRAVTIGVCELSGEIPCIRLEARYSKRRRQDVVVLTPSLAEELRAMTATLPDNAKLFPLPKEPGRMIAQDLKAAGIAREAGGVYVDFHALRHTAITRMVNATGNLRLAQQFARHSTPTLTARYAHVELSDLAAAVGALPVLPTFEARSAGDQGVQRPAQRAQALAVV